jgi:hypothetical protein
MPVSTKIRAPKTAVRLIAGSVSERKDGFQEARSSIGDFQYGSDSSLY